MEKIPTLFEREGWKVVPRYAPILLDDEGESPEPTLWDYDGMDATEKIDGTNVRLTVRSSEVVRVEARRNPTKAQKQRGIIEPWYRDVWHATGYEVAPADQYILEAANDEITDVPDGEWPGEAVGPKIQGNPLGFDRHTVVLFSYAPVRDKLTIPAPVIFPGDPEATFEAIVEFFETARSVFNPEVSPEGIVWWGWAEDLGPRDYPVAKIKRKDFAR